MESIDDIVHLTDRPPLHRDIRPSELETGDKDNQPGVNWDLIESAFRKAGAEDEKLAEH